MKNQWISKHKINKVTKEEHLQEILNVTTIAEKSINIGEYTNEDIEDAFSYGYDLLSMGFPALADPLLVDHLKNNIETTKVISKESLLPQKLMNKLIVWLEGTKGIYSVK